MASALEAVEQALPRWQPRTHLDLGTGCGAALVAARSVWHGSISKAVGIDRSARMLSVARELLCGAAFIESDLEAWAREARKVAHLEGEIGRASGRYDLVTVAYTLSELSARVAETVIEAAWAVTSGVLVIVEPGTPAGFERLGSLRTDLIARGGQMVAPCPHDRPCPVEAPDWCHFAARVARSRMHRQTKHGVLAYEDEKHSYLALSPVDRDLLDPSASSPGKDRIIGRPRRGTRRVSVTLCTCEGERVERIVPASDARYRDASKAKWGATLERGAGRSVE